MAMAQRLAAPSSRGVGLAMEGPSTPPAQPPQTQATATIELDVPWGLQAMQMPTQKEQAALFAQLDFNGNGVLSLAEVDAAVTAIWPTFTHRAAVLRAFRAVDPKSSGLIEPGSFGTLLAYLSAFAGILDEFDQIDTSHDHRLSDSTITKEEVVGACALLKVGVTTAEARQAFDRMEQVRPNHILFDDFAGWIAGKKIGLPSLRARRSPAPRASPGSSSPRARRSPSAAARATTSPQRPPASSPSSPQSLLGRAASSPGTRQARASTPSGRQAYVRRGMAQSTVDRLHNEDRDRRAAREARAQAVQKEREEAEVAELQTAPRLNQTSLAMAKRVQQTAEDSGSSKTFIERDKQWMEARERKLETHRSVLKSEREESLVKGSKMNAKSHVILEKKGRLPNTPIADRLHSAARAQQEKARLKRQSEESAEARRKNTVYSAYVPGGRVRPGRTPCVSSLNMERERIQSSGDRLMQQAREKEKKLEAARREAEAKDTPKFTPKFSTGSKRMQRDHAERLRRFPLTGSPEEAEPELEPELEPEPAMDPGVAEETKRRRRMERRAQQTKQREYAADLLQKASDSQHKRIEKQRQQVRERDRQMGSLAENMAKARASVTGAKQAKQAHHARHSEFLEKRRQYSSPMRQRRERPSSSRSATSTAKPVLTTALHRLYEGLTSQRAAREAFESIDKDGDGLLDAREIKVALRHLQLNLNDKQVAAVLDHIDADHDGMISIDEFMSQVFQGRLYLLKHRFQAASYSFGGMDVPALFRQYDRNNSGSIEFQEFEHAARRELRLPKVDITSAELRELFDHVDSDHDDKITLDEFEELLRVTSSRSPAESQQRFESIAGQVCNRILAYADEQLAMVMTCFHRFDADSDGQVDRDELRQALLQLGVVLSKKELSHVMQDIDLDGDGLITAGEFSDRLRVARHDLYAQKYLVAEMGSPGSGKPAVRQSSSPLTPSSVDVSAQSPAVNFGADSPDGTDTDADGVRALTVPGPASVHEIFLRLDPAGQNHLSLSEVAQGVTELWPDFDDAPALMRAYRAADSTGDGWIGAEDFQHLLTYLAFFHHRWPLFNQLDEEYDGKIPIGPIKEHCLALGLAHPGDSAVAMVEELFAELDPHGKGWIAFEEFCSFAARAQAVPPGSPKQAWVDADSAGTETETPVRARVVSQTHPAGQVGADTSASSAGSLNAFSSPITVEQSDGAVATAATDGRTTGEVAAAAVSAGSPPGGEVRSPQSGLTVSEAVEQIKTELALDPSLDLVDAVSVAWEKLRLGDAAGLRLKPRVQTLCAELDIEVGW